MNKKGNISHNLEKLKAEIGDLIITSPDKDILDNMSTKTISEIDVLINKQLNIHVKKKKLSLGDSINGN